MEIYFKREHRTSEEVNLARWFYRKVSCLFEVRELHDLAADFIGDPDGRRRLRDEVDLRHEHLQRPKKD